MKIRNDRVINMAAALAALQGEKAKFSGLTTLKMARNLKMLREASEVLEQTRNDIIKQLSMPGQHELDECGKRAFLEEFGAVLKAETELPLQAIDLKELRMEENQIHANSLSLLLDTIITGEL